MHIQTFFMETAFCTSVEYKSYLRKCLQWRVGFHGQLFDQRTGLLKERLCFKIVIILNVYTLVNFVVR